MKEIREPGSAGLVSRDWAEIVEAMLAVRFLSRTFELLNSKGASANCNETDVTAVNARANSLEHKTDKT